MIWLLAAYLGNVLEQLLIMGFMQTVNPLLFTVLFYFFAFVFTGFWVRYAKTARSRAHWQKIKDQKTLIVFYVCGALLGNATWFAALYLSGLSTTAIVGTFTRVIILSYAFLYMKDRFPIDKAMAIVIGLGALVLFTAAGSEIDKGWGILCAILSCFGYATEKITSKKLAERGVEPGHASFLRQSVHVIFFSVVMLGAWRVADVTVELNSWLIAGIMLTSLLGGLLVNVFLFYGLRTVQLSRHQALVATKPILLTLMAFVLFGEQLTGEQMILGSVIFLSSLYFLVPQNSPFVFMKGLKRNTH